MRKDRECTCSTRCRNFFMTLIILLNFGVFGYFAMLGAQS